MYPLISIISVNYNELGVTCEFLDSIKKCRYPNIEVWVVDNASKENSIPYINEHYPEVKTIRSEVNLGFAGGNNLAVERCKGDYLFFINNDAELTEGAIEKLIKAFDTVPQLGVVSPKICFYKAVPSGKQVVKSSADNAKIDAGQTADIIQYVGTTPIHSLTARNSTLGTGEIDNGQYTELKSTAYAHGAAMMVSRAVIDKVGPMWEDFFLYYEELDWCARIKRGGFDIYIEPNAKIYHKESFTTGKLNALKTYYLTRNRILFMRRNQSILQLTAFTLFLLFFTLPKNILMYLVKRDFMHLKAFLKAIWWNILDVFSIDNTSLDPIPSHSKIKNEITVLA